MQTVEDNYGLAVSAAKSLYNHPSTLYDLDDLVQVGLIGLTKATRTFDPTKSKFSTYGMKCCQNEIIKFLKRQRPNVYRPSAGEYEDDTKVEDLLHPSLTNLERDIILMKYEGHSYVDISRDLGVSPSKIRRSMQRVRRIMNHEKVGGTP